MIRISVLIVSWNARERLARCLRSLDPAACEVVVVDNASADGSAEMVAREFPGVRLDRQAANLGFAGGVNRAARLASAPLLLLLNSDASAEPGSVDELAHLLDAQPGCGAVAGRLFDSDGRPQRGWNVRRFPTLGSLAADLLLVDEIWPSNPATRRYLARDLDESRPGPVEQPAAACLMVRRAAFEAVGGMDEGFFPAWFEDVDFCRRLHAAGWAIWFAPAACFRHEGGVAKRALGLDRFTSIYYRNLRRYVAKHHGGTFACTVNALIVAGMIKRMALALARGRPRDSTVYARVLRETLSGRPLG